MLILTSMQEILGVIMKYVALSAIASIPRFYYASLVNHKALGLCAVTLPITKYRHDNPLEGAGVFIHFLRFVYKTFRIIFCSFSFYFMPFFAIFINFKFMITDNGNKGGPLFAPTDASS